MSIVLDGTTGITAPTVNSSGDLTISDKIIHAGDTNTAIRFPADDTVTVETAGAERVRVDSSGNVGVGMAPTGRLSIRPSGTGSEDSHIGFGVNLDTYITTGADGIIVFREGNGAGSNTERARIDASGNLLVGKTVSDNNPGVTIFPAGEVYAARSNGACLSLNRLSSDGAVAFFFKDTSVKGSISVTASATAYNTSSDYRLKDNVAPMQNALDKIAQLNPVTYTWKANGSTGQGFIAHELQAVVPDCVTGEKDAVDAKGNPQYQGVDTSFLVATLVKAIQELTARVAELEAAQ